MAQPIDEQLLQLKQKQKGYGIYRLPDETISEVRKLLLPRPENNVIIFMCIGLGKKEQEIVNALKDDFNIYPVGVDINAGTYKVKESTKDFPVVKKAIYKSIKEVVPEFTDKTHGIVVGFNMMGVDKNYNEISFFYHWPTIYSINNTMVYGKTWADYVHRFDKEPIDKEPMDARKMEKTATKNTKKYRAMRLY